MDDEDHKECKNWIINFIDEYRKRYEDLYEETRKHISNLENFNPPCQIIIIVIPNQKFTYLWLRKDSELPDKDIQCYIARNQDEFNQIAEKILSDKEINKAFIDDDFSKKDKITFRMFIQDQLIQVSRRISQLTPEFQIPQDHFVGGKFGLPMKGFFWIMYGDIVNINLEAIINEIVNRAIEDQNNKEEEITEVEDPLDDIEKIAAGYSTYFYPPVWIGEKPVFDFSSKVDGKVIFSITQISVYKNKLVSFDQKGFFFIEAAEKAEFLRYMNEIVGTADLLGYNFNAISEQDVGETLVIRDKGQIRRQTSPKSITRSWQAGLPWSVITEDMINTYQQITEQELLTIVTTAEKETKEPVNSDFIIFFAQARNHIREGKYKEAFLFDWLIIERGLRIEWEEYLKTHDVKDNRLKKMKRQNIDYVIESLSMGGIISMELYNLLITIKGIRNRLYHKGEDIKEDEEIKCHQISEYTIRKRTGIK